MDNFKFKEPKIAKRLNLLANIILNLNWIGSIISLMYVLSEDSYIYLGNHIKTIRSTLIITSFLGLLILSGCIRGLAELIKQQALNNSIQLNVAKNKGIMTELDSSVISSGFTGLMEGYKEYKSNS